MLFVKLLVYCASIFTLRLPCLLKCLNHNELNCSLRFLYLFEVLLVCLLLAHLLGLFCLLVRFCSLVMLFLNVDNTPHSLMNLIMDYDRTCEFLQVYVKNCSNDFLLIWAYMPRRYKVLYLPRSMFKLNPC